MQVPPQGVSNEMARFLRDEIDSVRELEMLLLLRSAGARATTPAALSAQLRTGVPWAEEQLSRMEAKGFVSVTRDGAGQRVFRYAPAGSLPGRDDRHGRPPVRDTPHVGDPLDLRRAASHGCVNASSTLERAARHLHGVRR